MAHNFFIQQLNDAQNVVKTFKNGKKASDVADIISNFEAHYSLAKTALYPFFQKQDDVDYQTENATLAIKQQEENAYSITAFVCSAIEYFGFTDKSITYPVITAALLSDIGSNEHVTYHNHLHFMRVVTHMVRLIAAHNFLESNKLSPEEISKLIIAACIHDLDHNGQGNIVDGKYNIAEVESKSFALAYPFLCEVGVAQDDLDDIKVMLKTTDVTIFPGVKSPVSYLFDVYGVHFENKELEVELASTLSVLSSRKDLCFYSMLLHEADIMNSAGLTYEITREESIKVSKEVGRTDALPEHTLMFLEEMCHGTFLTEAAKMLGNKNLKNIIMQVKRDYNDGNKSYF